MLVWSGRLAFQLVISSAVAPESFCQPLKLGILPLTGIGENPASRSRSRVACAVCNGLE